MYKLQQYLPFTVLKLNVELNGGFGASVVLQQYLPFTVLKLPIAKGFIPVNQVATVLTVYGIETQYCLLLLIRVIS